MGIPQIIVLIIIAIELLLTAHNHGKPRGEEDFWRTLVGDAITAGLLYWGGFFK